jgi:Flp pilus assembly protein CpaB
MRLAPSFMITLSALLVGAAASIWLAGTPEAPRTTAAIKALGEVGPRVDRASGKETITIPVHEVIGLAGLVLPGDRVDVFVTQTGMGLNASAIARTDRVLLNVPVVAVAAGETPDPRMITVEVTPAEREMIALATRLGRLSLMLRSAGGSTVALPPEGEPVVRPQSAVLR